MSDIKATGDNYESVFGDSAPLVEPAMKAYGLDTWVGPEGTLPPHIHRVDGLSYTGGKDSSHPDLRIDSFLLNARAYKTRSLYIHDKAGIRGESFAENLAYYASQGEKLTLNVAKMATDNDYIRKITNDLIPTNGVSKTDKFLPTMEIHGAVVRHASSLDFDANKEDLRMMSAILISILDHNGYVDDFADMKKVVIDDSLSVTARDFERAFLAHELSRDLDSISLDMREAMLSKGDRSRVRPAIVASDLDRVLSRIVMILRSALDKRHLLRSALWYATQMAMGNIEAVPINVRSRALELASNWNIIEYGAVLNQTYIKPKDHLADDAVESVMHFINNSKMVEVMRATDLARHVRVSVTRNPEHGHVESVVLDSRRERVNGRDIFHNAGSIAGFDKLYVEPQVQDGVTGLLQGSDEILPHDTVLARLVDALAQVDFANRLVLDFTAVRQYDRDVLVAAVAITRSHKVKFAHTSKDVGNKRAKVALVYYVQPTERLTGAAATVNLLDELRTLDAREVIAVTGPSADGEVSTLPGYDCTLKLDESEVNYVDVSGLEFIQTLAEPIYTTTIQTAKGQDVNFSTTPLEMLDMKELDSVYSTFSMTNYEDDVLTIRMFMSAWMVLGMQKESTPEVKVIDSFRDHLARLILDHMVDITVNNQVAAITTENLVRQYANSAGVYKNYGRFYSDERVMMSIRMYVASVLMTHLSGASKTEIKVLHQIVNESDTLSKALGSRTIARLAQNSKRV
jgi:hypothetical protein